MFTNKKQEEKKQGWDWNRNEKAYLLERNFYHLNIKNGLFHLFKLSEKAYLALIRMQVPSLKEGRVFIAKKKG